MLEMMKGYLQLAAGLGEMSRRKAMDAARDLVEGMPVAGLRTASGAGPEALAAQVASVADELMTIGRQNRRLLAQVVRTETEAVLASLGVRADRGAAAGGRDERLDDQLRALRDRVDDLERQLRGRVSGAGETATSGATRVAARRATPRTTKAAAGTRARGAAGPTKAAGRRAGTGTTKAAAKATLPRAATGKTTTGAGRAVTGTAKVASKGATPRGTRATVKRTAAGSTTSGAGRRPARGATS